MSDRWFTVETERAFADTNLFLRYLTNDVPTQADAVEQLLRRASAGEIVLVINSLVIAEIVWTLESYYGLARDSVKSKILAILNTPGLEAAEGDLLLQAISWYADKNIDFIDAFNAAWLLARGLTTAYTFDHKHFSRLEGIRVQVPGE
jgi:predicted nucleic-acid-binding protein